MDAVVYKSAHISALPKWRLCHTTLRHAAPNRANQEYGRWLGQVHDTWIGASVYTHSVRMVEDIVALPPRREDICRVARPRLARHRRDRV